MTRIMTERVSEAKRKAKMKRVKDMKLNMTKNQQALRSRPRKLRSRDVVHTVRGIAALDKDQNRPTGWQDVEEHRESSSHGWLAVRQLLAFVLWTNRILPILYNENPPIQYQPSKANSKRTPQRHGGHHPVISYAELHALCICLLSLSPCRCHTCSHTDNPQKQARTQFFSP